MSDFALRFGLALIVVIVAGAAIIISRRNYAKAAIFESSIEAFRLEFRRSIDAAQAATIKSVAKTIRESISSVIKPIDTAVLDLDARLARLEQQRADATASHVAQSEILEVRLARLEERADGGALQTLAARLARLEERADGGAIQTLDARLAGLEKHNESTATKIAGTQKQALEENERIAARLIGLEQKLTLLGDALSSMRQTIDESVLREQQNVTALGEQKQNLTALSDQLSSIKQTIDAAAIREKDIKNSIDAVSSRVLTAQTRVNELFPRLVLGDKARNDLSALMSWFVKRLKTLNSDFTETSRRLGDLESRLHAQTTMLEEPATSIFEGSNGRSPTKVGDLLKEASKSGDRAGDDAVPTDANPIEANPIKASPVEAKTGGGQAEVLGRSAAGTEPSVAPSIEAL